MNNEDVLRLEGRSVSGSGLMFYDPSLVTYADVLEDIEKARKSANSKLKTLTGTKDYQFKLPDYHPDVMKLTSLCHYLQEAEDDAISTLKNAMKRNVFHGWVDRTLGVGEKTAARLLGVIGDPYWNARDDRPRGLRELWSYCGYGDAEFQRRRHGVKGNWNPKARMRCYLIAECCMKQMESPYRKIYDAARDRYADAVHDAPCPRCGPKGKPAQPGSPLSLGHQNARGLRAISKHGVLRDLWNESRRLHGVTDGDAEEHAA